MIRKTVFGAPFDTQAITAPIEDGELTAFSVWQEENSLVFTRSLSQKDSIYGLGETTGPVNKRGRRYISFNTDTGDHSETNPSLYGSHNFLLIDGETRIGAFFDTPSRCVFELDYESSGVIKVSCETTDINVYIIEGESAYKIVREFLLTIGQSYLPPLWAFGYGQSRFGYKSEQDFTEVVDGHKKAGLPLDYICMDIDYMDGFADFTVNKKRFPNLTEFAKKLKAMGIRLVPIVDAGVKIKSGEPVYESGVKNGCFCRNRTGGFFKAGVWPGMTHFPDFLNTKARTWFGEQYRFYTEQGIEGFWNDMNEPSIFYSEYTKGIKKLNMVLDMVFSKQREEKKQANLMRDYRSFFHDADGKRYCHYDVHNVFGYLMTRSANEGLTRLLDHRFLLFSRSSYIGAGRYGGVWTGDNTSCWEHILLLLRQLPSMNMCGFLYVGSDTGGFMGSCSRELLLRWLAVSVFTPLMRNHCGMGMQRQECYQYGDTTDFVTIVSLRYRLLPYIYSEYMKAALTGDMYIKPLSFLFPDDDKTRDIEDQLIVGDSIMIAPVIHEGQSSREVYLPEDMTMVRYNANGFECTAAAKGTHTVEVGCNEVVFFILGGKLVPLAKPVLNTAQLDWDDLSLIGDGEQYALYCDDGLTRDCSMENIRILQKD